MRIHQFLVGSILFLCMNSRRLITTTIVAAAMSSSSSSSSSSKIIKNTNTNNANNNPLQKIFEISRPSIANKPILLGSASFTRKLILKEMGIPYIKYVRPIDEKSLGDRMKDKPSDLVLMLAKAKMDHLILDITTTKTPPPSTAEEELLSKEYNNNNNNNTANNNNDNNDDNNDNNEWLVLTGDQVVVCDNEIMEKPESTQEAKEFCSKYAKFAPSTVGSCVITHLPSKIQVSGVDTATIYFNESIATSNIIDKLIELKEPILHCAGGLMIEHPLTKQHLLKIDGTEDSVMGLSKDLVLRLLQELSDKLRDSSSSNF